MCFLGSKELWEEIKDGCYKSPCIPSGKKNDHAHSASADVRQNGEKFISEKHLIYVGNLAGGDHFITAS